MARRKVRTDLAVAFGGQAAFKLGGYVILALLARHLPREAFGEFFYLLALASLLVMATELGTSNYLVRSTARDPTRTAADYVEVVRARVPLVLLFLAGMPAFIALTEPALLWAALGVALYAGLKDLNRANSSVLYGLRQVVLAQLPFGGTLLLTLSLIVLAVRDGATLSEVVLAYVAWGGALFVVGLVLVRLRVGPLPWRGAAVRLRPLLRLSLPLFAVDVLALVHFKVDTVMLGLLRPMTEVAAYEAAARLLEASQFLVRPLTLIFFPVISALVVRDGGLGRLRSLLSRIMGLVLLLGGALAAGVTLLAPWIVPFVFGAGFDSSIPLLRILFLSVPGLYVAVVAIFTGNALHIERWTMAALAAGVVLNLGLNAVAIPRYGPEGAAWATLASQTFLAIALVVVVWRTVARGDRVRVTERPGSPGPEPEAGGPVPENVSEAWP